MIVDCFPWFAPYGEELLVLRVNLLKDHVDKFIIVESDQTHSGKPVTRKFLEIARKNGLPMEKIIYVEHNMPAVIEDAVEQIDHINAGHNKNIDSVHARARERLQKDAVMQAMDKFNDNDIFIYGDADEVIKPENIQWVSRVALNNQNHILKIPLVYLQGRADLRIYHRDGRPVVWWRAMFFATKKQIMKYKISNIRCGNIDLKVTWPAHDNKIIQDMGWHFAWMGTSAQRQTKASSFAHAFDSFDWMTEGKGYKDDNYKQFVSQDPAENNVAPDGNDDHILKRYPIKDLPNIIFENKMIKDFLLPSTDIKKPFAFNDCKCFWCQKLSFPLLYDLDGDKTWFEIPRSCSVTVKETHPNRVQIMRTDDRYSEIARSKKPIVIFTDPVDRFISCINAYVTPGQRYYHYGLDIFESFNRNLETVSKQEKIDLFFEHMHKIGSVHQVHHFHPQCRFVDTQRFKDFTVVLRKDVSKFFGTKQKLNTTKKDITRKDLSKAQISFINNIYKSDNEFLKKYGNKQNK